MSEVMDIVPSEYNSIFLQHHTQWRHFIIDIFNTFEGGVFLYNIFHEESRVEASLHLALPGLYDFTAEPLIIASGASEDIKCHKGSC